MRVNKKNFGRFFPKLNEHNTQVNIPSMLILSCNIIETLRLRKTLAYAIEQRQALEGLYVAQNRHMRKEGGTSFTEPFKFGGSLTAQSESWVSFVEDGPASDLRYGCLAINEFDPKLRSSLNFSDPECFKALILPLGLEELRAITAYELMSL